MVNADIAGTKDFAASLVPDSSALVLVGEEATLADFVSAVEPCGGKVVETRTYSSFFSRDDRWSSNPSIDPSWVARSARGNRLK